MLKLKWNLNEARNLYQSIDFPNTYALFRDWRTLQEVKKLTFAELQLFTLQNIDKFKDKFSHILVDEAQDLSPTQWEILNKFNANKIVIGDDDQSIYSFRGANPHNFLSLPYKKEFLTTTYRYDTQYARNLEKGIRMFLTDRQKKEVIGKGNHIKVHYYFPVDIEKGVILARINSILEDLSYSLLANNIPHILEESSIFISKTTNPLKKKFKHALVFLNSKNINDFATLISSIIRYKNYNNLPVSDRIEILKQKYKHYYDLFNFIKDKPLKEKVKSLQYHEKIKKEAQEMLKIKNIEQFLKDIYNPQIILSTIHRFKGRESENIYIYGFKNGLFPLKKANWKEEVRVAYVALSRTKGNLYLDGNSEFVGMI